MVHAQHGDIEFFADLRQHGGESPHLRHFVAVGLPLKGTDRIEYQGDAIRPLLQQAMTADSDGAPAMPLLVSGTLESLDPPRILVRDAFELEDAESNLAAQVRIRVGASEATRDRMLALRRLLEAHVGDCGVLLHILIPGESETIMALPGARGVDPSEELISALDGLFGHPVAEVDL